MKTGDFMAEWSSEQYLKFANERNQPSLDLISRLERNYNKILDLGCGPGNSTNNLKNHFQSAEIIGFDGDENMLSKAEKDYPNIKFIKGFAPDDFDKLDDNYDLVFSNACIHWIKNQQGLIEGVESILSSKGTFAVQIPLTNESAFYKILYRLVDEKWHELKDIQNFHNLDANEYYNLLSEHFSKVTIWKTDYYHTVDSKIEVIEWYKGSGLRPYLSALDDNKKQEFINDIQKEINKSYSFQNDGKVFLIMPRLFFIAEK